MSWLEKMFGGHHGGHARHGSEGRHGDGRRYHNEDWGRTPGNAPLARADVACPKCNTSNAEGARFCSQCATPLLPRACSQCSQSLAQGAKFCSNCGAPVNYA